MAYALEHGESVRDGVRRILSAGVDKAIADLTETIAEDASEAVHSARKHCKQVRAVARLVRPALGDDYAVVNQHARDAARELSDLRDAAALAVTFSAQHKHLESTSAFETVADVLAARSAGADAELRPDLPAVRRALGELEHLQPIVGNIELDVEHDSDGWDAIGGGLALTYGRGRRGLAHAFAAPTPENYHEWRKRVKYSRHHVELLARSAPEILGPLAENMHSLSDLLGDAHDLAVIGELLRSDDPVFERIAGADELGLLLDGVQADRERRAVALGRRLYAEPTERFTDRLGAYWSAWR